MNKLSDARIFFSYARRDKARAEGIYEALEAAGLTVYRDTEEILPAEDWRGRLKGLITGADGIVFVMSPNSVRSTVCSWEIETAVEQNKRIIPLVIEDVDNALVPPEIEKLNYIFATPDRDFDAAILLVRDACTTDIDWVRNHTKFGERADEWHRTGKSSRTRILRGDELSEAETWLSVQPDTAPPPTARHREWIGVSRAAANRRQRNWLVGAITVAAISIGLGIFAEFNRQIAAEQRDRAETILDRGSQTANDLVFDLAQRFRDREGIPQELVRDILERSRGLVDQLALEGEHRPDLLRSRAAALTEMSVTLARQGDLQAALSAASDAAAGFAALLAAEPEEEQWRKDRAASLDRLGDILLSLDQRSEAGTVFAESLALNRELVAGRPGDPASGLNLAVAFEKVGTLALLRDDIDAALTNYGQALALRETHEPDGRGIAVVLEKIGQAQLARDDIEAAEDAYMRSLSITRTLSALDPSNTSLSRDLSVINQKIGELRLIQNDPEGALSFFKADAEIARRLYRSDPGRVEWAEDLVVSEDRLGQAYWRVGAYSDAEARFSGAFEVARAIAHAETGRTVQLDAASRAAQKLSLARFSTGDTGGALETAEMNAADLRRSGELTGNLAAALNNVAWYGLFSGDTERALAAAEEAIGLQPDNEAYALNRAHALMLSGRTEDARAAYLEHQGAVVGGQPWALLVSDDFGVLREHGIERSLMSEIEDRFASN
ncbi:MAG: TIR domain-containing protein [Minwuia sp.]|uniref:TIR domain-containing protein n=1 Tax=Minwuia sp. TaxID=2493630 RepID=UPI003A89CAB9